MGTVVKNILGGAIMPPPMSNRVKYDVTDAILQDNEKMKVEYLRSLLFIASVTSYFIEKEAKNLQNGDVHIAQIPDFEMEYLENHLEH